MATSLCGLRFALLAAIVAVTFIFTWVFNNTQGSVFMAILLHGVGPGVTGISEGAVLNTHNTAFTITADVEIGEHGSEGMLAAIGGVTSGRSLYVKDGKPTFYYNFFEVDHARIQSSETLPMGKASARVEFTPVEPGFGKPAEVKLFVNGKQTGNGRVEKTVPVRYSVESFDIGRDTVSPVSKDYKVPFAFQGRIEQVTIEVK